MTSESGFRFRLKENSKIENRKIAVKIDRFYRNKNNVEYIL